MAQVVYREMSPGEEPAVCELARQVFDEFVAPEFGREGIEQFYGFADPAAMTERLQAGGFVLVASRADRLVGILEFVPPERIAMLFVALRHQGIAKALFARAVDKARAANRGLSKVTVHSSFYAEPIYLRMGFRPTGSATTDRGVTYIPMELTFEQSSA
jgi:GNAT superfamily N-acetyltransferase